MANATKRTHVATTPYGNDDAIRYPLASTAATYYPGELIGKNAEGYACKFDDASSLTFLGTFKGSHSQEVPTGSTNGQYDIFVARPRYLELRFASIALTDVGTAVVYGKYSDGEAQIVPGSYGNVIGVLVHRTSATVGLVEVFPPLSTLDNGIANGIAAKHRFFHDFNFGVLDTTNEWELTATDSGTVAIADGVGGTVTISPSDGTVADNDEAYLASKYETFLFAASKPILFETRLKLDDTSDAANILVGLADAVAANTILDNGGGPKASYSGVVFFKVDGGTVWQGEVSVAGTQVTDTDVGAFVDNTFQTLRFEWIPTSSTSATAYFYVNGVLGGTTTHTFTSGTEMQVVLAAKNGSTDHAQLVVDYVLCEQTR